MTCTMRDFEYERKFLEWVRRLKKLDSIEQSLCINNIDISDNDENVKESLSVSSVQVNKFAGVVDGSVNRETRRLMNIEFKFWRQFPKPPQLETIYLNHKCLKGIKEFKSLRYTDNRVYHFGHYIMCLPELIPDDNSIIKWYSLPDEPKENASFILDYVNITTAQFIDLMLFKLSPITLKQIKLEKNKQTKKVNVVEEVSPGVWEEVKF